MKEFLYNKSLTILLFIVSSLAMEAFLFIYLGFGFLPKYIMFDLALIFFVSFIILFLPCGKAPNIVIGILLFLQLVLSYMNICIYTALGDVFTFDMLSLVDETTRVITKNMFPVWPIIFYSCLYAMDIVFLVLIRKKIKTNKIGYRSLFRALIKDVVLVGLVLSFSLYTLQGVNLAGDKDDEYFVFSDKVLYNNFYSSKQSLIKFGTWGYYFEEFFRRFYQVESVVKYTKAELLAYIKSSEYDHKAQRLYNVSKDQNVLVVMMESMEWYAIDPELTPTLYALANGYDFGTRDNNTGLYSNFDYYDFDVLENGETALTRKDYLYDEISKSYTKIAGAKSLDENNFDKFGLTLTNYYSKSKTDYSEASVILGNYPYNQSFTTHGGILGYSSKNLYSDVSYSFTLPNVLKSAGVVDTTNYMHSYLSTFYGRDTLIPQFGFDNVLFLDQMDDKIERGDSLAHIAKDSQIIDYYLNSETSYDFMPKDKKFLSFYTTVTTHGDYSYNPLLEKNYEFVDSLNYLGKAENGVVEDINLDLEVSYMVRSYLASVLDTEYMVTLIVKYLMENDMFDSTMLVLFSDHQCYYDGMDKSYKSHYYTDDLNNGFSSPKVWERDDEYGEVFCEGSQDRYEVPAIIYSTRIDDSVVGTEEGAHFVDKFTCSFDLTVTMFNLLGVDYNTSYYLGYPVFCEVLNSDGSVEQLGVPAYISCTGGVFDAHINTEDGRIITYYKSYIDIQNALPVFSYNVSEYIERWYRITALYQYNLFK